MRKNQRQGSKRDRKSNCRKGKQVRKNAPKPTRGGDLVKLLRFIIPDNSIFASCQFHGNTKWQPYQLVMLALLWAMSGPKLVTDSYDSAASACQSMLGNLPTSTYQGMMNALVRWTNRFVVILVNRLQLCMKEIGGDYYCVLGYVPIAFDGSRVTVPRTAANEKEFCAKNYGNGEYAKATKRKGTKVTRNKRSKAHPQEPQIWITMLWHMGLRLPWCWKLGPSDSSERTHVMDLVENQRFPKNTLFCGDAGFVGYPIWQKIIASGYDFVVRVGANVSLLAESHHYNMETGGIVLCWPKDTRAKGEPLRLRLVQVKVGTAKVWLLTSVLSEQKLTKVQMVAFYKMRWGIEVEYRGLKRTLCCAKMCCLNPLRSLVELNWDILAMAISELLATREQLRINNGNKKRTDAAWTPKRRSLATTMRVIRKAIEKPESKMRAESGLSRLLGNAVTDKYIRKASKQARHLPRPNKKPLKPPIVKHMTPKILTQLAKWDCKYAA